MMAPVPVTLEAQSSPGLRRALRGEDEPVADVLGRMRADRGDPT
jgi:hypothetical protein